MIFTALSPLFRFLIQRTAQGARVVGECPGKTVPLGNPEIDLLRATDFTASPGSAVPVFPPERT
jgi:hypothetical protein